MIAQSSSVPRPMCRKLAWPARSRAPLLMSRFWRIARMLCVFGRDDAIMPGDTSWDRCAIRFARFFSIGELLSGGLLALRSVWFARPATTALGVAARSGSRCPDRLVQMLRVLHSRGAAKLRAGEDVSRVVVTPEEWRSFELRPTDLHPGTSPRLTIMTTARPPVQTLAANGGISTAIMCSAADPGMYALLVAGPAIPNARIPHFLFAIGPPAAMTLDFRCGARRAWVCGCTTFYSLMPTGRGSRFAILADYCGALAVASIAGGLRW